MTSLNELKLEVDNLQEDINEIKKNTSELLEAWSDAKGALKALALIGGIARWITAVAGASALFYMWLKKG